MQQHNPYGHFWQWFRGNGDRLLDSMYGGDERARNGAVAELHRACEASRLDLVLELTRGAGGGPRQLVVSADGRLERVDPLKEFVASAPELPGWEVVPFRPRMQVGDSIAIRLQDESVGPEDVWFLVTRDEVGLALTLYVRGLTPENEQLRGLGASLLAEHAVGERDALTLLNSLNFQPLPANPAAEGLRPFRELVPTFDATRRSKYPPPGALAVDFEGGWQNMQGTIDGSTALVMLHTGLLPLAGHPDYDRRLAVSLPFDTVDENGLPDSEEEYTAVSDFGDRVCEELQEGQESLFAMSVMSQGRKDLIFYTSDPESALRRVEALGAEAEGRRMGASVEWDTFWGMYRSFCGAGQQEQEDEE
jgi:hypothetical protein